MATGSVSKSAAIRTLMKEKPSLTAAQAVSELGKRGVKINARLWYNVMGRMKNKTAAMRPAPSAARQRPAGGMPANRNSPLAALKPSAALEAARQRAIEAAKRAHEASSDYLARAMAL